MARDATNMPFPRSTSYQESDSTRPTNDSHDKLDMSLKVENMLLEEFNYASVTAYQSMEDRARLSGFYYVLLGVLASGLAAIYQTSGGRNAIPYLLVGALLVVAAIVSVTFFITIIRLRQAYRESILCMNVIKEFYIQQFKQQMPAIENAFRWRLKTIPMGERIGSVTFMMGYLNALIGSLCLAGAVFIGTERLFVGPGALILSGIVFVLAMLLHILYYRRALSRRGDTEIVREQAMKMGVTLTETTE